MSEHDGRPRPDDLVGDLLDGLTETPPATGERLTDEGLLRAADLQLVHSLLEQISESAQGAGAREARVAAVMDAIRTGGAVIEPKATAGPAARSLSLAWLRSRRAGVAVAAMLVLGVTLWGVYLSSTGSRAMAALEQAVAATERSTDRTYRFVTEGWDGTGDEQSVEALLHVRGGRDFVLRVPSVADDPEAVMLVFGPPPDGRARRPDRDGTGPRPEDRREHDGFVRDRFRDGLRGMEHVGPRGDGPGVRPPPDERYQGRRRFDRDRGEAFRREILSRFDADGDGVLSPDERAEMQTRCREAWAERRQRMLASIEAEGDGEFVLGYNGREAWRVTPSGKVTRRTATDVPEELRRIGNVPLPLLHVRSALGELRRQFDVTFDPKATLADQGDAMWHHLKGVRRAGGRPGPHPTTVEVWCDPQTGVVQRLVVEFGEHPERGPKRLTFDLVDTNPLAADWYDPSAHLPASDGAG